MGVLFHEGLPVRADQVPPGDDPTGATIGEFIEWFCVEQVARRRNGPQFR